MQYKAKAIILKTTKLSESDKILTMYSPELGLIKAVAKGAFKVNSSHGIKAQALSYCDFLLGKGRSLDVVSQSKLIEDFRNLRGDYNALTIACFFADITERLAVEDNYYEDHFHLLLESLKALDFLFSAEEKDSVEANKEILFITLNFLWDLIKQLGYKPELERCTVTHELKPKSKPAQYFDFLNGGITSTNAYMDYSHDNPYQSDIRQISTDTYRVLQGLDSGTNNKLPDYGEASFKSAIKLLHKHLQYSTHKEFKSWKLMEGVLS